MSEPALTEAETARRWALVTSVIAGALAAAPSWLLATVGYASREAGTFSAMAAFACGPLAGAIFGRLFPAPDPQGRTVAAATVFGVVGVAHAGLLVAVGHPGASGDFWPQGLGPLLCVPLPVGWTILGAVWGVATLGAPTADQ